MLFRRVVVMSLKEPCVQMTKVALQKWAFGAASHLKPLHS